MLLVSLFGVTVLGLLVAQRFADTTRSLDVEVREFEGEVTEKRGEHVEGLSGAPKRGSVIATGEDARVLFTIDGTHIALDENTVLEFRLLTDERIELYVPTGRVAVNSQNVDERAVSVSSAHVDAITVRGSLSFVNYNFDQRLSIIPFTGVVGILVNDSEGYIIKTPIDILDTEPYTVTDTTFTVDGSVAEDFYRWFGF